jgi:prepilin-type N-terminal cleavage/methylation domain-containing protein
MFTQDTRNNRQRNGFTLIEMLAVISVLVILISLVVTSGILVIGRQNVATTRGILSTLDRTLQEYYVETDAFPPFVARSYELTPGRKIIAGGDDNLVEDYLGRSNVRHPDASVFLQQARGVGQVNGIISGIGDRFTMSTDLMDSNGSDFTNERDTTPSILDSWADSDDWAATANAGDDENAWPALHHGAHLIFYVHPDNRLAQDLYGRCVNGRPYFFSAGPDGLYGTTSQFSATGAPDQGGIGVSEDGVELTFTELAVLGLEDNIYSYEVGPAHDDDDFNGEHR